MRFWIAIVLVLGAGGIWLYFAVNKTQMNAQRLHEHSNLKMLACAMHAYHNAHGRLPPQASYDPKGMPLLSWRVLLLPFMEQRELYKKFKLDESWDSPHNLALLPAMPPTLASLRGEAKKRNETHYQVLFGPGAAFEGTEGLSLKSDFPDGAANTLLIVQAAESVPWTKPIDLPFGADQPLPELGGIYPGVFPVAFANFAATRSDIQSLPDSIEPQLLRAMVTRNGAEKIDWNILMR